MRMFTCILLTPAHELLPAKSAVSAKYNPHLRPVLADPLHQQSEIGKRFVSRIHVRGPELGIQQLIAAKHIQRQVTVAVVITMKEPSLLMSMKGIIGGIHIQNDFIRCSAVAFHKHIHKELIDLLLRVVDLLVFLVLGFSHPEGLQAVQRTLSGQRDPSVPFITPFGSGGIQLPTDGGQKWVSAQLIVIVEILVAQTDSDGALSDQLLHRVFYESRISAVDETSGELLEKLPRIFDFPQKQCAGVRSDGPSIKAADYISRS